MRSIVSYFLCFMVVLVTNNTTSTTTSALQQFGGLFSNNENNNEAPAKKIQAAVLVPGFLTGANDFRSLCDTLTRNGLPTVAVDVNWIPCLGGRSARPVLERIDFTVQHLLANGGDINAIPSYDYGLWDCYQDFQTNPGGVMKVGGSDKVDEYPTDVQPRGNFPLPDPQDIPANTKIALIGHSAGGWISRAYLSSRRYGGKAYCGQRYVHSLVTLGTPHENAPGPAFEGIQWCNQESVPSTVRSLAVGGTGFKGTEWGSLTQGAYSFCCPTGSDGTSYDGDGLTPIFSSLAMPGAEQMSLDNVTHFCWSDVFGGSWLAPELAQDHKMGRPWYGTEHVVEKWADWIVQ